MKMKLLISVALVLSLAACVETQQAGQSVVAAPLGAAAAAVARTVIPRGKAQIYLFREKTFAGSANAYRIFINGQPVADMSVGTKVSQIVPPGRVTVSAETVPNLLNFGLAFAMMEKPAVTLATQPGATYAIKVSTGFAGGPVLTIVSDATAVAQSAGFVPASAAR